MAEAAPTKFSSAEDQIVYWKQQAEACKTGWDGARAELEEFQGGSRDLEAELEAQLTAAEKKMRDLVNTNERQLGELEMLREKCDKQHLAAHRQAAELEARLSKAEAYGAELRKYVRELEQTNDDLERAKRAAVVSLEDFEARLNQAIERNAFLESELDDKADLVVCVQRLKDEARDLRQELAVTDSKTLEVRGATAVTDTTTLDIKPPGGSGIAADTTGVTFDAKGVTAANTDVTQGSGRRLPPASEARRIRQKGAGFESGDSWGAARCSSNFATPVKSSGVACGEMLTPGGGPMTFSGGGLATSPGGARTSALRIVSELLQTVNKIESKMLACNNMAGVRAPAAPSYSLAHIADHRARIGVDPRVDPRGVGVQQTDQSASSPTSSPSMKRVNMGESLSALPAGGSPKNYIQLIV